FHDLRYHPRCPWGPKPHTRFLPALLIAAREGRTLRSIQRIFLDLAHGGYLDKATLGTPGGATWQGMRVTDTLALGEGFETSAAFTQIHGIPCWATLGAARLDRVHIPDSVTTLIFAEDNDFEGRRARRKAWAAYRPRGLTLKRMPPPSRYGDWADVVKPGA
ncbi:MAG: virulence-associated protein E, partial [Sphingomonadales bacterium]|nr:virulence-associated protein E [Sphingomonadales bacterium]